MLKLMDKKIFMILCCWYSEELSQRDGSFEHPKHLLKLMDKTIFTIFKLRIYVYFDLCVMFCDYM